MSSVLLDGTVELVFSFEDSMHASLEGVNLALYLPYYYAYASHVYDVDDLIYLSG